MRRFATLLLLFLLSFALRPARADDPRPELRAFWADGFNDGYKTPQQADQLLQRLHDAHFNAIFAQVRKSGDAYYASHYEPWASDDANHFDALAYLIAKAHAMNPPIAVHAWINACAVGTGVAHPLHHIRRLHPDWLSVNEEGDPNDHDSTKIDPGNPDAADWTFRVYLDVARHYDVDGIHFDFIRYGAPNFGYNAASVARFERYYAKKRVNIARTPDGRLPAPKEELWRRWRRDQVTNLVRKVMASAAKINPRLVISAAVIAWQDGPRDDAEWRTKSAAMNRVYQDWQSWLKEGDVDLACPMTYFRASTALQYARDWSEFIKNRQYHRAATVGVGNWENAIPQTLSLLKIARERSAKGRAPYGTMLYSYAGTNVADAPTAGGKRAELQYQPEFYAMLGAPSRFADAPPFPTDAPIPPMDWKLHPKTGIVKGFVLDSALEPVSDVVVTAHRRGQTYARRTDATGFYAIADLPPGEYAVRAKRDDVTKVERITVVAGEAATVQFTPLGGSGGAARSPAASERHEEIDTLLVTMGSDVFPGSLFGIANEVGVGMRVRFASPPVLPFQAGDVVAVRGTPGTADGERVLDNAVARLIDIAPMRDLPAPVATTGRLLLAGKIADGFPARIQGVVTESSADGFTVDDGAAIRIDLRGLKDFGVEATGLGIAPPPVGSRISIIGIVSAVPGADGRIASVRLRPRGSEDATILPPLAVNKPSRAPLFVGLTLSGIASGCAFFAWKRFVAHRA